MTTWWQRAKPGDKVVAIRTAKACWRRSQPWWRRWFVDPVDTIHKGTVYTLKTPAFKSPEDGSHVVILTEYPLVLVECSLLRPVQRDRTTSQVKKLKRLLLGKPAKADA